jgi:DNA (cytosine-5)-methyltransferase 1
MANWYHDRRLRGTLNHASREHMPTDHFRYFYASAFAAVRGVSPRLRDFPPSLLPNHQNVGRSLGNDNFADRFRVQLGDEPAVTIMSHIARDGHYVIHPDPEQSRSLTVRETARLQTFPDNYFFCGARRDQYTQVGNAVPPLLAYQIAEIVAGVLGDRENRPESGDQPNRTESALREATAP